MDQDSTNGSGPDKRNWRERLGIGAKEMPKLSDEFRDEAQKAQSGSEAARPAPRGAQPVTSPAPMAPRAPKAPASSAPSSAPSAPATPAAPRATPRMPDNAAQEALAEKLRAQRAAAEKLAEQRVQAARDRAEGKSPAPEPAATPSRPAAPRLPPSAPAAKPRAPIPPAPGGRPKFSFAEEPASTPAGRVPAEVPRPGLSGAPLTPPRPALGNDRGQPPFLRPSAPGLGGRTQPPYKPVDPNSPAGYGPPPRLQPPPTGRPGFGGGEAPPLPSYPAGRPATRRPPPALESYPRQDSRDYAEGDQDDIRQAPRLGRPAPRGRAAREDLDEVFEDDGGSRQRASAKDYQSAYGESDVFAEDTRRSSGPWLLILAILATAMIAGAGYWYYNNNMKTASGPGAPTAEVPVVNAPPEPAKVEPETPAVVGEEPAAKKKQIYDRIVGEQEVIGGQLQQTEETPVPPAAPASEVPAAAGTNAIPAPDAPVQGTDSQGLPTVDEPPPLPLPPAGEQGNLQNKAVQQIAAASAQPEEGATAPPAIPLPDPTITSSTSSSDTLLPPPPEKATDGAAPVSDTATPASATAVDPAQDAAATVAAEPPPAPAPPPKKKPAATAEAKKKPQQPKEKAPAKNLGAEPVVLVPPAEPPPPAETETAASTPVTAPSEAAPAAPARKRTIMDLFRGAGGASDANGADAPAETRVAAAEPPPAASTSRNQAEAPPATGSGFVIQLASFRSEADARKEYKRLSAAYPSIIGGLQDQIRQTSVGGSTRYQLGLGPLPSRSEATKVCSQLITQGESDCIVRGR